MRLRVGWVVTAGASLLLSALPSVPAAVQAPLLQRTAAAGGAWTVYHHDDGHTGYDPTLPPVTGVTSGWVSPTLDGEVYAEPLIFNGVVYAATLNDTVYAINQSTGAIAWSKHLGTPQTSGWQCGNISPTGILGTPVIDTGANRLYAVAEIVAGGNTSYHLYGLDLGNSGNVVLDTTLTTTGFDWTDEQERGALAVHGGYVYVPFGGRAGDCGSYHGYVFSVVTSNGAVAGIYQTPGTGGNGFWAAGGVVVDDSTGNVFVTSGNGNVGNGCSAIAGGAPQYENDAVVRLSAGTVAHQDAFMPSDWQNHWCSNDQDLGGAGPLLISSSLLFQAGKWGAGFLLNPNSLGGVDGQLFPTPKPQTYSEAPVCFGNHDDQTFGSFAYASPFVYVECEGSGIVALHVSGNTFTPCDAACGAPDWSAGGGTYGPPIVAAGAVWAAQDGAGLTAFDAATGNVIYQSPSFGINRFVTPAAAGGHVYVPSHNVIRSFDMLFLNWISVGGTLTSSPEVATGSATSEDAFVRGTDNGLWQNHWNGTAWGGWTSLGGGINGDPGAIAQGTSRIDVFVRGTDNRMYTRTWNGASWSPWALLAPGTLSSGVDASMRAGTPNTLDLWVQGTDGQLYHRPSFNGGSSWAPWEALGGRLTATPGAVSWSPTRIDVFVRGTDLQLYHKWYTGGNWYGWEALGGTLASAPDAASCASGHLDVYVLGTDHALYHRGFDGTSWSPWASLGGNWSSAPSAECRPGTQTVDLFERSGGDLGLWTTNVAAS